MNTIGVFEPDILLPKENIDLKKWAVVACDQFTSSPEYWEDVEKLVGQEPSTNNLIFPEAWLGKDDDKRIARIHNSMKSYLAQGILREQHGFILVERETKSPHGKRLRTGLMINIDLEQYDYNKGSTSLIRATEGTILDRIPPRVRIRQGAPLELPHIMMLVDDPKCTVIEPLVKAKKKFKLLYDTDLMKNGGHISGYAVDKAHAEDVLLSLQQLAIPDKFQARYGFKEKRSVLLFAVGDGNHSLATAKAVWEATKKNLSGQALHNHPARYALVELVNVHDSGLEFAPIHRVLFDVKSDFVQALKENFGDTLEYVACAEKEMMKKVGGGKTHVIGIITSAGCGVLKFHHPKLNLPVATIQNFLDPFMKAGGAKSIDYVHGDDVVVELGAKTGNVGLYLPSLDKNDFFITVLLDGVLPRKTFSMGEANEKRYYLECRRILP